ncbi:DICT sensory domain-containing protein [Halorussus litoreus]|uniref:DICT sensory domain-containing protein n=1 Tax=Halorussus litoreus TaxID=1710536 RepID=UPI000E247360|nr:DICT sensory domain-containing protein [Halorussus litoreus]
MTLSSIIEDVTGEARTLTVYDSSDPEAVQAVEEYFSVQRVSVEEATAPDGPDDFVVLHDDGEFLAAADLETLRRAVSFETGLVDSAEIAETPVPEILTHVGNTTFTSYGKRRMILASREIEEQAWRTGDGELHSGFQDLSLFRDQWDLYERVASHGVDIHAYGVPDWRPPEVPWLTVHGTDSDEIRQSWFVAFDAPDDRDCALVATEREPNEFEGFWTYDGGIVGDVFGHLRETYS